MRRALILILLVLAAGCAGDAADAPAMTTGPAATASPEAAVPPPATPPSPSAPRLGILYDETYSFEGRTEETRRTFDVERGVQKITFFVASAGPPADRGFTSASMGVYTPRSTGAMFSELPGQEARSYTLEQTGGDPYWGTWTVIYGGTGNTSVTLRVTAE